MANVTVIILTLNEELNLPYALNSIKGFTDDICVVDSGSTDNTENIAKDYSTRFFTNSWPGWGEQRNWAIQNCNPKNDWILFLDADEQLTKESRSEIDYKTSVESDLAGYNICFDYYFIGKPLSRAMKPHYRLIKNGKVTWKTFGAREICNIPDNPPCIKAKLIHKDHKGLRSWMSKQTTNAFLDAQMIYEIRETNDAISEFMSKKKYLYYKRFPILLMPLLSFFHKILCCFSFKNIFVSFLYITALSIWYQIIVALHYYELIYMNKKKEKR